jgi:hypothetical protein
MKTLFYIAAVSAGCLSFFLHAGNKIIPALLFALTAAVSAAGWKSKRDGIKLLLPLSSGLLCFLMRLFYWDSADFSQRVDNLIMIALAFCALLALRRFKVFEKFLVWFNRLSLKKRLIAIFIFSEILFIIASVIIVRKGVQWGGDEPHYLVISHSIARDFDLNVFDQYARDRYREFVDVRLHHHARVGKGFKVWYSYGHLPGLSLTLAPFMIFKIPLPLLYYLVRAYLGLFGALLAVVVYLFSLKLWRGRSLAIFITGVLTVTAPVFFYSLHLFAELQAALLILSALYLLIYSSRPLLAGLLLGLTVWWGLKYALFIYLFCAGFFIYFIIKKQPKRALLFVLFPFVIQLLFFGYLYYAYGNFDPMSIYNGVMTEAQAAEYYGNVQNIPPQQRVETLLGILFDQRDGLLLYNPFYLLALPGLILALKKFKTYWRHILVSSVGFGFILFIGYSTVRAGYCPQARYLTPVIWVLMLFAVVYYRETQNLTIKKWFLYLPVYSLLVVIYQVFHPFTLYQSATHLNLNRPGLMFQEWSNSYFSLPDILPSFVKVPGNFKYLPNLIFFALLIAFTLLALKKMKNFRPRFTAWIIFVLVFIAAALFPRVPTYNRILVNKPGTLPTKIHGQSPFPTNTAERKFPLQGQTKYSYTLSSAVRPAYIVLEFENNGPREYEATIANFDETLKKVRIPAGAQKVFIENPRYKSFKGENYYRFHLELAPPVPDSSILYLQLYGVKKKVE